MQCLCSGELQWRVRKLLLVMPRRHILADSRVHWLLDLLCGDLRDGGILFLRSLLCGLFLLVEFADGL